MPGKNIKLALSPRHRVQIGVAAGAVLACGAAASAQYVQTNLVSDQPGMAAHTDPNLVNPWGLAFNPAAFVWVANNGTGTSTLYDGSGAVQSLVVNVPTPIASMGGAATGMVYNGSSNFVITHGAQTGAAPFIWATEDGTISAWNPTVGSPPTPSTQAFIAADRSTAGAVYKGLTIASPAAGTRLLATDFHNNRIDVFNSDFSYNATASAAFVDPTLPAGFAPFNAKTINNEVYVTYAQQGPGAHDENDGAGLGYIDVFHSDGTFDHRLASQGVLNAPWGMALAPSNFGAFSNDLIVGNFGDGRVYAFDPATGAMAGTLTGTDGQPIDIDGLWGLEFGNGMDNQPMNSLFFTAGPDGESHGLYGSLSVPSPSTAALCVPAMLAAFRRRRVVRR